jgi:hypothetical protein
MHPRALAGLVVLVPTVVERKRTRSRPRSSRRLAGSAATWIARIEAELARSEAQR